MLFFLDSALLFGLLNGLLTLEIFLLLFELFGKGVNHNEIHSQFHHLEVAGLHSLEELQFVFLFPFSILVAVRFPLLLSQQLSFFGLGFSFQLRTLLKVQ